jgi:hypothetical protein
MSNVACLEAVPVGLAPEQGNLLTQRGKRWDGVKAAPEDLRPQNDYISYCISIYNLSIYIIYINTVYI